MKTNTHIKTVLLGFLSIALISLGSCQKDKLTLDNELQYAKLEAITISSTSAIAGSGSSSDTLYAMDACKRGNKKTPVEFTNLPASISTYLNSNYSGYAFLKAFQITNESSAAIDSYAVMIQFNNKPVALKFDSAGTFVKVFEIREGRNIKGKIGWHLGGCFENRDGKQRDTIAISSLPVVIKTYMSVTYASDTLVHAFVNKDQSIIVISKNTSYFATAFSSSNLFLKRIQLPAFQHAKGGKSIEASVLPVASLTYLSNTYPNYVFKKAFEIRTNDTLRGYLVLIDANLTKYAINFDASGQFVSVVTIR